MLHYERKGSGKEFLILLHGFMENLLIWEDLEEYLSKDFTLIKVDLPGHGRSPIYAETHTMSLMAKKVNELIEHLKLDKIHLLGHSMGGYVSLAFAEMYPDKLKSLTLFFSTYYADSKEKKEQRQKSLRIIEENLKAFVNAGVPNFFNPYESDILEGKINLAKEIALSTDVDGITAAVKGMKERPKRKSVLDELDAKILVISGKYDNAVNSKKTLKHLPKQSNVKSYLIDCGHNGHWEKPAICAAIINTELLHNMPKHLVM